MTHHPLRCAGRFGRIQAFTQRHSRPATIALIAFLVLLACPALVLAQPEIQWELVNPFRFIHDQNTIDELKTVFASTNTTAAGFETALQDNSERAIQQTRANAANCNSPSPAEKRKCFAPYSGWFARVAEDNYARTCWDWANKKYRRDGPCADYIDPTSHRVRVWVANSESLGDTVPQWMVDPAPTTAPTPCDPKYGKRFCIEFNVRYQEANLLEVRVSAQFPNVPLVTNPNIKIRDLFIVGLGDSFAAGEGNPDIPATFVDSDLESGRHRDWFAGKLAGHDTNEYPAKERDAVWLDKRCHRSMYSYQFKTALQLALRNPQQAVTFVSFSCSGAVTGEIIDKKQNANEEDETLAGEARKKLKPQLEALRETLKSDNNSSREIDYLLLSTGGNDVGFANYVAYILLRNSVLRFLVTRLRESKIKEDFASHDFQKLLIGKPGKIGNYLKLQNALLAPGTAANPNPIRISKCRPGTPCAHIILTPYPNLLTDEAEVDCKANRLEFNEFFGQDDRVERIQLIKRFVFDQITDVQTQVPAQLRWTLVAGNVDVYRKHGFCSRDGSASSNGEKFPVPTWLNNNWIQFPPRDYKAYESRFRWFRLPVDSVLTTDQAHMHNGEQRRRFLEYARSNIMHPTAQGLAHTADLNVEEILKLERTGN